MLNLTKDQEKALDAFNIFLTDPTETVFVLSGYSGTGKTTLVRYLLQQTPKYLQMMRLIDPSIKDWPVVLTATTNKAAENFSELSGETVSTIHSYLGLRVQTDYSTGVTTLIPKTSTKKENSLVFIDEASYVDSNLLSLIFKMTHKCKIVFIGDPAQLTPVKSAGTPVFNAKFSGAQLSEVVRQAKGNPITDLSTQFRNTVNTGEFFSFTPDGQAIKYLERKDFNQAIEQEFNRFDWSDKDSKVLAWTNKCVINYNHAVSDLVGGTPEFKVGDYAVCNKFVSGRQGNLKTDQMVQITGISSLVKEHGVEGNYIKMDHSIELFCPKSLAEKNALMKKARAESNYSLAEMIDTTWIDLRAAYACTINKSQGSTYDRVFIDLDDVRRCNSGDQIARMLYVGVSRARKQVFLTGDIA